LNGKGGQDRPYGRRFDDDSEPKPLPLGDSCNPLCPYFRCSKKALKIEKKYVKGMLQKVSYCMWVGDNCIAGQCQYAFCEKRALLPGNKCAFAIKPKGRSEDFERDLAREEQEMSNLASRVSRRGLDLI
jgi:hypothetical protein